VVSNGDVAGLTLEASVLFKALGVFGGLDDETEIDAEALETSSCFARIVFASGRFAELGREADGTIVNLGGKGELWDAFDELVGVR
jgi:hypothetical protein